MSAPKAENLPVGSVVADEHTAFIRAEGHELPWLTTRAYRLLSHRGVDILLDGGAQVLRVGDGTGES